MAAVAVSGVLLIACVNLAGLQLARSVARDRDNALRAALGAGPRRLFQTALSESVILSAIGGAAGIFFAFAGVRVFVAFAPANLPRLNEVHVSWPILFFAAGLSILTAIAFGTLPSLRSVRINPQQVYSLAHLESPAYEKLRTCEEYWWRSKYLAPWSC